MQLPQDRGMARGPRGSQSALLAVILEFFEFGGHCLVTKEHLLLQRRIERRCD